jgi:hypothetical protein
MTTDAMKRDVWPRVLRQLAYVLYIPFPRVEAEHINATFRGIIDRPNDHISRSEYLIATRAALASDVDLTAVLGFEHSDAVVREFLSAVEKRLSEELGE